MNSPESDNTPRRLGKNKGAYGGETIDIQALLSEIDALATKHGWESECVHLLGDFCLRGYRRSGEAPAKKLYLSSGIHGDEPAGPLAARELFAENDWPESVEIWFCPCLNPMGYVLNRRENEDGVDLNRDYRHLATPAIQAHVRWLEALPKFDASVILHEDWESGGFYLYELNPDSKPSFAERVVRDVAHVCPIEQAPFADDWPVHGGIIRPEIHPQDRPQWAEALYLVTHKTPVSYTLEAPSDFPLAVRIAALVTGVRSVLRQMEGGE